MPTGTAQTSAALAASVAGTGAALTAARAAPRQPVHCSADGVATAASTIAARDIPRRCAITSFSRAAAGRSLALERLHPGESRGYGGGCKRGHDARGRDRGDHAADERQRNAAALPGECR